MHNDIIHEALQAKDEALGQLVANSEVTRYIQAIPNHFRTPAVITLWVDAQDGWSDLVFQPDIVIKREGLPTFPTGIRLRCSAKTWELYAEKKVLAILERDHVTTAHLEEIPAKIAAWISLQDPHGPFCRALIHAKAETKKLRDTPMSQLPGKPAS